VANPTIVSYKLPTSSTPETGNVPIAVADIKQINIGIRPKSGVAGTYPMQAVDVTIVPAADGFSTEPLAVFGLIQPGDYFVAAQTVLKAGGVSVWSVEAPFTIAQLIPNPPTALSAA
jgi:hypothetical protein